MTPLPLPLLADEIVLKEDPSVLYVKEVLGAGYHLLGGRLWLTNFRLVHQDFPLGRLTVYPLSHLTQTTRENVRLAQKKFAIKGLYESWAHYEAALRLAFDNQGLEYFIPSDIESWVIAITQARQTAPELAYTQMPPLWASLAITPQESATAAKPASSTPNPFLIIGLIAFVFICLITTCLAVTFLLIIFSAGNS